jgi:hypothetical protein
MPFNQRAALIMRELEGRSYTEIADTLGVSVSAVETLIFRARRSLRVRTAALRSILTVPVPPSLAQFFGSGGAGAAGGLGAGVLIKTAVALVVGGLVTGIGVEAGKRAIAAPRHRAAQPGAVQATSARSHPLRTAKAREPRRAVVPRRRASRATHSSGSSTPAAASVAAAPPGSASTPTPAPSGSSATTVVGDTVQTVVGTVDQVTPSLPVSVPQVPPLPLPLPVQAPPLPKLP